jgi:hypothetical protein
MWPMNQSTKENLVITALGIGSAIVVVAGGTLFAIYVADWQKWFRAVCWTTFIFGFAIYWFGRDLLKPRCLAMFAALLLVHVTLLWRYLGTADRFPDIFFLVFSPFEITLVAVALMLVGGKPSRPARRPRRHRLRLKHDTPESTNSSGSSDTKGGCGKPL